MRATPCSEPSNSDRCVGAQRLRQGRFIDRESVVLRGNQHPARIDLHHRVVGAVMSELHLDGLRAACEAQKLVAEANAENRYVRLQEARDGRDRIIAGLRIAGTVT